MEIRRLLPAKSGKHIVAGSLALAFAFVQAHAGFNVATSTTRTKIQQFLGTDHAKLVYVNMSGGAKELHYIDFSEAETPVVHKIAGAVNPTAPVLSPDGKWVVYATGANSQGEAGTSVATKTSAYICRLAEGATPVLVCPDSGYEPRFVQNSQKLTVIFPTKAPNLAWEGKGKTAKVEIDTVGGVARPGPVAIFFEHGAYTGGISIDNKFLCGGGGLVAMLDLTSGRTRPDTLHPLSGQSCNASVSSSRLFTNTMMYLDFGRRKDVVAPEIWGGRPWSTWHIIFISRIDKQVLRHYVFPTTPEVPFETFPDSSLSGIKWHHPEWSNHPYFAAATVNADRYFSDGAGGYKNTANQERIYLVNLKDSAYHEVLRPQKIELTTGATGLFWPGLWVEIPAGFQEQANWIERSNSARLSRNSARRAGPIRIEGTMLCATSPIRSVRLYALDGTVIRQIVASWRTLTVDLGSEGRSRSGSVIAEAALENGSVQTLPFTLIR